MKRNFKSLLATAIVATGFVLAPGLASADDIDTRAQATYDEIQQMFGGVPAFVKLVPKAAIPGLWAQTRDLELSDKTALPPKTKALIALAVASQVPCHYCIWLDTNSAKQAGASDQEIGEAVAMAGLTRQWSAVFHGLQVDFDQLKKDMGGGT
jgi:AhpD family alkylhydroperoxidase